MFNVIAEQMVQECNHMERETLELSAQGIKLDEAISELKSLSAMGEAVTRLEHLRVQLDTEDMILRQMAQALNKALLYYINCENRVCGNAEQSVVTYAQRKAGMNRFSAIADILGGI